MFKRILIAHDGTELADKAFDYGIDLAEKYKASITVMSVIKEKPLSLIFLLPLGATVPIYPTNLKETIFNNRKEIILENIEEIKQKNSNLQIRGKFVEGDPAEKILEVADEEKNDLIVMGSSGIHGLKRLIFGSVSDSVRINSEIPILIIK